MAPKKHTRKYRKISTHIWNDEKFRELSDSAKLVFFFLLTHPQTTSFGAIRGTLSGFAEELGWETKGFAEGFWEGSAKGMAEQDEKAPLFWLPKFLRHNKPENPNVIKSWLGGYEDLPECALKKKIFQHLCEYVETLSEGFQKGFQESFAEHFGKGFGNQEQEQEQEYTTIPTQDHGPQHVGSGPTPDGCVCGEDDSPPPGGSPQPKPPIQNEPEYSQEFFEFMAIYGEPPNDGAWLAWCAVCRRTNFTALWRANLDSWLDCDRWQRNFKKDAKNFLRDGDWQRKAPEAPVLPAGEGPRANSVSDIAALERDKMARDVVENRRRRYEQNGDVRNNRGGNQGSLPAAPASQDEHGPGEDHGLALAGGPGGGA